VAREPLFGLSGLRLHLLVGRAVAFVGGLVPGIGEVVALVGGPLPRVGSAWAWSRAAARWASLAWAVCNAASACPAAARTLASSTARPAIRSRWAPGQPLGRGRPPSARLFSFIALAVVGEG
jgi:hypothetical protein